jgi:hypothetical protein
VKEGVAVRISAVANGTPYKQAWGTVQEWAVTWLDSSGNSAISTLTISDVFGSLPEYTFRQASDEIFRTTSGLLGHWPLRGDGSALVGTAPLVDNGGTSTDGGLLPLDEGTEQHQTLTSSGSGRKFTLTKLAVRGAWVVGLVVMSKPTGGAGDLLRLDVQRSPALPSGTMTLNWNGSNTFTITETGTAITGGPVTAADFPLAITINSAILAAGPNPPALQGITVNPTLSGGMQFTPAHLWMGVSAGPDLTALVGPRVDASLDPASRISALSAGPTITGLTAGTAALPNLEGRGASDALSALIYGMGARIRDNLDSTLSWISFPPSTATIALPAGELDPDFSYKTSDIGLYSDATIQWNDGTSTTVTRVTGTVRNQSAPTIEEVYPTRNQAISWAQWLVNNVDPAANARIPAISYDLATLTDAQRQTVASVTIGARVSLSGLPSQIPSSAIYIVEGISVDLGFDHWIVTLKLSPDVLSRLFIVGDAVQGKLDAGFLIGP